MFEHFAIMTLRATYAADAAGTLPPYLGSTLRGLLGHCMRGFACRHPDRRCYVCEERKHCAYAVCFSSPGGAAGPVNAFVLHSLTAGKTDWSPGDSCTIDLTLIGAITRRADLFLRALQQIGKLGWGSERIPFTLEEITDPATGRLVYAGGRPHLCNLQTRPLAYAARPASLALVRFDTPVRILKSKVLCRSLSFETLMRSAARRLSLLSQAYTELPVQIDGALLDQAKGVKVLQQRWRTVPFVRYSMNQASRQLELSSIVGWALYEGNLEPFMPLLQAGQALHVGKNATHGFGHYEVFYDR